MTNFKNVPKVLRKQVYLRSVLAAIFLVASVLILIFVRDFMFALPGVAVFVFLAINVGLLLYDCLTEQYIAIEGICIDAEFSPVRKHLKAIYLETDNGNYKILIRHKLGAVGATDRIIVYVSSRAKLYDFDGRHIVNSYYAMEVVKK